MQVIQVFSVAIAALATLGTGCATHCVPGPQRHHVHRQEPQAFRGPWRRTQSRSSASGRTGHHRRPVTEGSVLVTRSNSDKVEVSFRPFCYAGYDEQRLAQQQLTANLRTSRHPRKAA